jgi:phosphoribosylformimino-5-aminoimidazole carboxamide ribotide isomerase
MKLIPAVDILGGRCVQLVGGMLGTEKYYGDPVEVSREWARKGAEMLHVVDLNATLGTGDNTELLRKIREAVGIPIQAGGGIRTIEKAGELLDSGVERVIIGTLAVEDYVKKTGNVLRIADSYGRNRVIAAVDSREGYVVYKGWQEKTKIKTLDLIKELEKDVWGFLHTNVDVEGQMKGVNMDAIKRVVKETKKPVIISGGISSREDIKEIEKTGAWGVVLGKALYEGRINLKDKN